MEKNSVTYHQNPRVDFLFGYFGGDPVPTKQDKFKPIEVAQIMDDGTEQILNNFYVKKPDEKAMLEFYTYIQSLAKGQFADGGKILHPHKVEAILSVCSTEKRFKTIDVDNLAKAILDSLNGIAYEDDSQVVSLICKKYIHPMKCNGLFIGITKLTETNMGFGEDIKLFSNKPWK